MLRGRRLSGEIYLTGANLNLYRALKARIEDVAAGREESTVFVIPAAEVIRFFSASQPIRCGN